MKIALIALALSAFTGIAAAQNCVGTGNLRTCTDPLTGNAYTVNRIGSTTIVNGTNAQTGSSWNQTTSRVGDMAITNGTAANGRSWNSTTNRIGDMTITNGVAANGRSFNVTTTKIGDMRIINGVDSDGNLISKTCTAYGCH